MEKYWIAVSEERGLSSHALLREAEARREARSANGSRPEGSPRWIARPSTPEEIEAERALGRFARACGLGD
mgnify:CR=1 FL=1